MHASFITVFRILALCGSSAGIIGALGAPLRGGKLSHYEGGVRVPFMMRWPGHIKAGLVYRDVVSLLDVLPTSMAAGTAFTMTLTGSAQFARISKTISRATGRSCRRCA